jgi:DUF1680 family protein
MAFRSPRTLLWAVCVFLPYGSVHSEPIPSEKVEPFPLEDVRLLKGTNALFAQAQQWDQQFILKLEPDRLLAPFRREAGLPAKAESYGNWENTGLDGHIAGHYLSALAFMEASTSDPALKKELKHRLDFMVSELAECQKANGNGYVGGIPNGKALWEGVSQGKIIASDFSLNKSWVPWYNLHKTFAGLRDAWLVGHNERAKEVLIGLSDWCDSLISHLSDEQMQKMLTTEYGGMNEVLADVSDMTGNQKYLALAKRFNHQAILMPLEAGKDTLDGLHANMQIPKVIGFERIAELSTNTDDKQLSSAAKFFWEQVTGHRSVAIGGNSVAEHFNPATNFSSMIERPEGPETCGSYNMLKLSQELYNDDPSNRAVYADYIERVLYNHILTTIDTQGLVYFTPMRPGHYRTYGTAGESFWCCVGTGMENHGKYGDFIYSHGVEPQSASPILFVNLFIPSELTWKEEGITLRQETQFPESQQSRLILHLAKPTTFTLSLRHPGWIKQGSFNISINGERLDAAGASTPSSYLPITRTWKDGDSIDLSLPMETSCEQLPDGSPWFSYLYGPLVLAASTGTNDMPDLRAGSGRWDHIAKKGQLLPLDDAPMIVCEKSKLPTIIHPFANEAMTFSLGDYLFPEKYRNLKLVPFYRLADSRYVLTWRQIDPKEYQSTMEKIRAEEAAAVALDRATVDRVSPGEQQPEVDHHFQGELTQTGYFRERHWRDASGWFSYDLKAGAEARQEPLALSVTTWGGDKNRGFDILVNGTLLTSVSLDGTKPNEFQTVSYPIPSSILQQATDGTLSIRFIAHKDSVAGGIFDLRLLKSKTP